LVRTVSRRLLVPVSETMLTKSLIQGAAAVRAKGPEVRTRVVGAVARHGVVHSQERRHAHQLRHSLGAFRTDGLLEAGKPRRRGAISKSVQCRATVESVEANVGKADKEEKGEKVEKEKREKKKKDKKGKAAKLSGYPTVVSKWSKVKDSLRPTQTALGYDWVLYKMKNLIDEDAAQSYLNRKPVPAVKRGDFYYVIDHHHTLAALEASGWDVKVTIVVVQDVPEDLAPLEFFWSFMEKRGMSFIRNPDFTHATVDQLPLTFNMRDYHNDIYRSMGGFARLNNVLKRPSNLQARLFFEFKWGYFFYLHRNDDLGLWHDKRLFRCWTRAKQLIEETDMQEYMLDDIHRTTLNGDISELVYLSENVIEPAYTLMMFYLRALCTEYNRCSMEEKVAMCGALSDLFGEMNQTLPEGCIVDQSHMYTFDEGEGREDEDEDFEEEDEELFGANDDYGDEGDYGRWRLPSSLVGLLGSK